MIPVFDWLNDPAYADKTDDIISIRQLAAQTLDYSGTDLDLDLSDCTVSEKDRLVLNPSHFVAKLELVPPPPPVERSRLVRYLDEDGLEFIEGGEDEAEEHAELPPLTPEQMRIRDSAF